MRARKRGLAEIRRKAKERPNSVYAEFIDKGGFCFYCDIPLVNLKGFQRHNGASVDHIVPEYTKQYGRRNVYNMVHCCQLCNNLKGSKSAEEFLIYCYEHIKPYRNDRDLLVKSLKLEYVPSLLSEDLWRDNGNSADNQSPPPSV